ncbi:unnamed protein product [Hermetia illucens]|uniref:Uncharacterized protein n=2 Tax=Hermetia illucens TaxID=343691 RepID=A0A7R8UXD5_HERIL|nr:unnamed protein product [Hermetia illucens]
MSSDQNRDSYDLVRELASIEVQSIQNRESNESSGTSACEVFPANHIEQCIPNETKERKLNEKLGNKCYRPSETTQCEQFGKVNTDKGDIGETHAIPNEEIADEITDINEEKKRGFGEDKNMNTSRASCLQQNDVNNPEFKNLERKSLKSTGKNVKPCNIETSEGNEDNGQISGCHKPPLGDMEQQSSQVQISEAKFATSADCAMIDHNTNNLIAAKRNNHDEMELNGFRNGDRQSSENTKSNSLKAALKPPLSIENQLEAPSMPALDASVETCNETLISKQTDKFKTECGTVENKNNTSSKSARVLPKGDISNDSFNESTGRLNTSALLSYETYLANHTTPVPVPASEDEIAGTPTKPKTTKKPRRTTQKAPYNALVGHRIEGFERRIPAKKSTLDTSRELKQELFREALGQRSSTPIKPLNLSSSSISDTSFNTSTTEVKGEKRVENDNQQMKMNVQKEKKNFKLNLDLSFGENRVITKEDVKVIVTDNDLRSMSNLSKSNSSSEGTNRSERDTKSSSGINSSSTTSSSDKSSTTSSSDKSSTTSLSDKSIIPSKSEDNFTSCTIDNVTAPSNYPTKKQKIMTQLMKQNSCEQLITNIVTASANGVNAKEESIPESGLESSDIEKKYPPAIKSANSVGKTSTMQNGDYSKRKNESLEQELPPPKRRNTVEEGHAINSAPDLNIQNLEKNILEESKDSLSRSRIAGTEISSHSGSDTAIYSSSTEKSNPSINSGDSSETKQSTCEDLGLKQNNGDNCLDLTNDMDTKRAAIEQLMRDLNWSSSDQHSSDLEKSETEKKSDDHMISMDKSKECDSGNQELSKFSEETVSDDPKSVESSKKNKIEILDVQIVTRGCALELPTANVRNNTDDVKGHSNQNIVRLSKNVDDSEKYRTPHDEEKTIKSGNTNRSRPSVTKKPLVQGNHTRNTRRANQNGMNAGESSKTKMSGTSNDHVIDKIVRDPNESSKTKPTISTASPTRDCKNNAPSQKINFNETENNSSHANTFAPMQKPESTSNPIQSTPKTYDKNNSLHDSELQTKFSPNNSLNESQYEKRNISMASSDYVIEKVDNNVINVFITRRKVKKKKKN